MKGIEAPGAKFDASSAAAALVLSNNLERKQTQAQNSHIINVNTLLKEENTSAGGEQVLVKVNKVYGCHARLAFKNKITKNIRKAKKVRISK